MGRVLQRWRSNVPHHSFDSSSPTDNPLLLIKNLSKRYKGGVWANQDINFTGNPSEVLGILGPNGAGKTTLVRQITSELVPTSGSVSVLGYDVVREPTKVKALLGVVPQEAMLWGYLSVYQHLRIFGKLRGLTPKDARLRTEELMVDLDLVAQRNLAVDKLSGGLKRRLLVGMAALAYPSLMILDEPTTGLDPQSRRNLWSLLRSYREKGTFVLLTTHYMEEAEALCDRVGIMQNGRLVALDTVANLRAKHGYEFKITYQPNGSRQEPVTFYGDDSQELVARVRAKGVEHFTVGPTNLEDIYLEVTGRHQSLDDRDDSSD